MRNIQKSNGRSEMHKDMWDWIARTTYARRKCMTERDYMDENNVNKQNADIPDEIDDLYSLWKKACEKKDYRWAADIAQQIANLPEEPKQYERLGIYENGDVIVRKYGNNDVLLDHMGATTIALIRRITGEPAGSIWNADVYKRKDVDFNIADIRTVSGWKALLDTSLIHSASSGDTFMQYILKQDFDVPVSVLEYLKQRRPEDPMDNLLLYAPDLETAKWLHENGARLDLKGTRDGETIWTLKTHWESEAKARNPHCRKMIEYFFGK